jgi:hypothetical protein
MQSNAGDHAQIALGLAEDVLAGKGIDRMEPQQAEESLQIEGTNSGRRPIPLWQLVSLLDGFEQPQMHEGPRVAFRTAQRPLAFDRSSVRTDVELPHARPFGLRWIGHDPAAEIGRRQHREQQRLQVDQTVRPHAPGSRVRLRPQHQRSVQKLVESAATVLALLTELVDAVLDDLRPVADGARPNPAFRS